MTDRKIRHKKRRYGTKSGPNYRSESKHKYTFATTIKSNKKNSVVTLSTNQLVSLDTNQKKVKGYINPEDLI